MNFKQIKKTATLSLPFLVLITANAFAWHIHLRSNATGDSSQTQSQVVPTAGQGSEQSPRLSPTSVDSGAPSPIAQATPEMSPEVKLNSNGDASSKPTAIATPTPVSTPAATPEPTPSISQSIGLLSQSGLVFNARNELGTLVDPMEPLREGVMIPPLDDFLSRRVSNPYPQCIDSGDLNCYAFVSAKYGESVAVHSDCKVLRQFNAVNGVHKDVKCGNYIIGMRYFQ